MSGTMGGVAQVLAGHPLDTVKVRLQTQVPVPGQPPQFNGMIDCFKKTVQHEGFKGLYKGAMSPLAGAMAHNAGIFFFYGQSKKIVAAKKNIHLADLTPKDYFTAGAMTGFCVNIVECPVDLLKCKLQAQVGKGQYAGVWDCFKQLYRLRGIQGVYQGLPATTLRNVPCFASYFYAFEMVKQFLTKKGEKPTLSTIFLAGGAAGFGFWGIWYPLDIIKTRLQTDATLPQDRKYSSTLDCVVKMMKTEGGAAFWRGWVPSIVRAIPINASVFLAVNATKRFVFGD
uniref:Mitochondrial carrier protein n=1 Tax=Arcella intermedia TaxID=1963864 RepID=A0A6B2LCD6_9EUKA